MGIGAVTSVHPDGRCVFFAGGAPNACAIQSEVGEEALPAACRHFPRVCLIDARGVFITLSHYCPTAARMLFRSDVRMRIVRAPEAFDSRLSYEGLDARGALPPLLRPGMLTDWEGYAAWEQHMIETLERDDLSPETALAVLQADALTVRAWRPSDGSLAGRVLSLARPRPSRSAMAAFDECARAHNAVQAAVPPALRTVGLPPEVREADTHAVVPRWSAYDRPIRRYLAARAFANWCAYQGRGLLTVIGSIRVALAVVRVEAARVCARDRGPLDEARLMDAFRQADLLLLHYASREGLAALCSQAEERATRQA